MMLAGEAVMFEKARNHAEKEMRHLGAALVEAAAVQRAIRRAFIAGWDTCALAVAVDREADRRLDREGRTT